MNPLRYDVECAVVSGAATRENRRRFPVRLSVNPMLALVGKSTFVDAVAAMIEQSKVGRGCEVVAYDEVLTGSLRAVCYPPGWTGEPWSEDRQRVWDGLQLLHEAEERKQRLSKERLSRRTLPRGAMLPRTPCHY